jgi:hypothetical protein
MRYRGIVTIPPMVSVFTRDIGFVDESVAASAPASVTLNNGYVYYHPIILPASCVAKRIWWANGATVAGNIDVGIYADDGDAKPGAKVISSGATAQSGTNSVQFSDVSDTALAAGRYWLAFVHEDIGAPTLFRSGVSAGDAADASMMYYEGDGTVSSLPSSATPLEGGGQAIYLFGFSTVTSP